MRKSVQNKAFTLAEVLVTIAIVGFVAAITIPTLMRNYQKNLFVTQLKKEYSQINEALRLIAVEGGCPADLICTGLFDDPENQGDEVGAELKKHLNVSEDCGLSTDKHCFTDIVNANYDGSGGNIPNHNEDVSFYKFVTASGSSVSLYTVNPIYAGCMQSYAGQPNQNVGHVCGNVMIDVNGSKKPNRMGIDVFEFFITNGKGPYIYPLGGSELVTANLSWADASGAPIKCTETVREGQTCAGRVIEQGWEMNY